MNVIIILLSIGVLVSLVFLGAFIWCIRSNQFEDDFSPSVRILFEDKLINNNDGQPSTTEQL